jgi:hypothetical protein
MKAKEENSMRENIDILRVYNLVDSNGTKILLRLGRLKGSEDYLTDKGFRWSFVGTKIPMPVRNATWFNGFPEATMLNWLMDNGWHPHTCVNMETGKATVYELPKGNEDHEGNEIPGHVASGGKIALDYAIKMLCESGSVLRAVQLYRYAHDPHCSLKEAKDAVDAIRFDTQA